MSAVDTYKAYKLELDSARHFMLKTKPRSLRISMQDCTWYADLDRRIMPAGLKSAFVAVINEEVESLLEKALARMQESLTKQVAAVKAECDAILMDTTGE